MGPPEHELRKRYLEIHLRAYDSSEVDFDRLVAMTDGVTQAFLKEFVQRAVIVCLEQSEFTSEKVCFTNEHFEIAFDELTEKHNEHAQAIVGFRIRET